MSIYGRLGFDFTPSNTQILVLSDGAKNTLNVMPKLLNSWQEEDVANSDTEGYFKNPVGNVSNNIIANTITLEALTNTSIAAVKTKWEDQWEAANSLFLTANNFLTKITLFQSHTNNVSGVNPISSGGIDTNDFPYYDTVRGYGKILLFLTNGSDGVLNNSPIIGSMTSLFIEQELQANLTIIVSDLETINDSFSGGTYGLSNAEIATIETHIDTANTLIETRRTHDINFYRNSRAVMTDYNNVTRFSNMGDTETMLTTQYIGTDKLTQRLANT